MLLAGRMGAYLDFASAFAPERLLDKPERRLFWVHRLVKNGLAVRLVGLNTALLCAGDDDQGKLRLGTQQLHDALVDPPGKGEVVIALGHHPLGWLAPADSRSARDWIRNNVHVHLSGHVHEAETVGVHDGGASGEIVHVVAGAVHNERQPESWIPAGHGYNWGAVIADESGTVKLRIWPRRWADGLTDFRLDVNKVPRGRTWAEHRLSVEFEQKTEPPVTGPSGPWAKHDAVREAISAIVKVLPELAEGASEAERKAAAEVLPVVREAARRAGVTLPKLLQLEALPQKAADSELTMREPEAQTLQSLMAEIMRLKAATKAASAMRARVRPAGFMSRIDNGQPGMMFDFTLHNDGSALFDVIKTVLVWRIDEDALFPICARDHFRLLMGKTVPFEDTDSQFENRALTSNTTIDLHVARPLSRARDMANWMLKEAIDGVVSHPEMIRDAAVDTMCCDIRVTCRGVDGEEQVATFPFKWKG